MSITRSSLSVLCLLILSSLVLAQPGPQGSQRPRGIYCSCPPTNGQSSSFVSSVAARPYVDGFLVRVGWDTLEPQPGVFDWTLLDAQLAAIAGAGKRATLAITQGPQTPSWLAAQGATMVTYGFAGQTRTIALAWDPVYLQRWHLFVAALGLRYRNDPTVELVHLSHATHNSLEMQLPFGEEQTYLNLGYSDAVYAQSYRSVVDFFGAAFPNKALDVDVHPVWGSDVVAQQTVAYGRAQLGNRFGAFGGWYSVNNALNVYPGMQEIFQNTAPTSFANIQNVGSWVTTPERYDSDLPTYRAAYELGIDTGVRYFEVWNADLLDNTLAPFFVQLHERLHCEGWHQVYPSAANPGVFQHGIQGCTEPGTVLRLLLSGGVPMSPALIAIGDQRRAIDIGGGQTIFVGPLNNLVLLEGLTLDAQGEAALPFLVPTGLAPFRLMTQGASVRPDGSVLLSNGLEIR